MTNLREKGEPALRKKRESQKGDKFKKNMFSMMSQSASMDLSNPNQSNDQIGGVSQDKMGEKEEDEDVFGSGKETPQKTPIKKGESQHTSHKQLQNSLIDKDEEDPLNF